jgi:DNA-binding XRE family transcriptional regulator
MIHRHRLQLPAIRSDCDRALAEAEFYRELAARSRVIREQLGLSQAEAARRARISPCAVSRMEAGFARMTTRQFLALRGAFE